MQELISSRGEEEVQKKRKCERGQASSVEHDDQSEKVAHTQIVAV